MDDRVYKVWLANYAGLSVKGQLVLSELFGGPEGVYRASDRDIRSVMEGCSYLPEAGKISGLFSRDLSGAEKLLDKAEKCSAKVLHITDNGYPEHLANIPDPPPILWYKGDLSIIEKPGIAIVGTRRCSPYGRWVAEELGKRIARCGGSVISGMAEGVDSAGHKGCIAAGGKTAAVFGTGIDICFPRSNQKLYDDLQKNHLTLSEIDPGYAGQPWNFPKRNRIISGLSRAIIVVEGALKSGSMITAGYAGEHGREVFAVPGNINQPGSLGTNKLIMDGATPITDLDSVPELLGLERPGAAGRRPELTPQEDALLKTIRENNGQPAELIAFKSVLPSRDCLALISSLELKGLVKSEGNRLFTL